MDANPVNWFEIPVNDMPRAVKFYSAVFGVELAESEMEPLQMAWFPMNPQAAGAAGTLVKAEAYTPSHAGTLVYFSVADIKGTLKKINDAGGKTLGEKKSIGEYGFVAHFEDCEGNRVALHSHS